MLTLISHIYNEEWLLPFWIENHKPLCDNCIFIDYGSTDRSLEIIREMAPDWEIRKTKNEYFDAIPIDQECMEIEETITEGYCLILNTTEFLICPTVNIKDILPNEQNRCFNIETLTVCSNDDFNPSTLKDLLQHIEKATPWQRSHRFIHSYPNGNYSPGRHSLSLPYTSLDHIVYILWMGYYPWCDSNKKRKLQIQYKISASYLQNIGSHHTFSVDRHEHIRNSILNQASNIETNYPILYNYLTNLN